MIETAFLMWLAGQKQVLLAWRYRFSLPFMIYLYCCVHLASGERTGFYPSGGGMLLGRCFLLHLFSCFPFSFHY